MKASLYAICLNRVWSWRETLDIDVDLDYWYRLHGMKTEIIVLLPILSWGQAVWLKQNLAGYDSEKSVGLDRPIKPESLAMPNMPGILNKPAGPDGLPEPDKVLMKTKRDIIKALTRLKVSSKVLRKVELSPVDWKQYLVDLGAKRKKADLVAATAEVQAPKEARRSGDETNQAEGLDPQDLHWAEAMRGKSLLPNEWVDHRLSWRSEADSEEKLNEALELQTAFLAGQIQLTRSITRMDQRQLWWWKAIYRCERCGSGEENMKLTDCVFCGTACPYCEQCLTMGRTRFCTPLILGMAALENVKSDLAEADEDTVDLVSKIKPADVRVASAVQTFAKWELNLAQSKAAGVGLAFLKETGLSPKVKLPLAANALTAAGTFKAVSATTKESLANSADVNVQLSQPSFLIWAVTGAGKTEIIFPLIEHELSQGRKVLIATPRKDVVLELMPRLQTAFPNNRLLTLYGGSRQRWEQGDITLATTHQLLRFYQAFDLVVIDELDAFPLHNNPMLEFAVRKACKPSGRFIFMTATPPLALQNNVKSKVLPYALIPVRYHGHPLPVPQYITMKPLKQWSNKQAVHIPPQLIKAIKLSLSRGAQVFVFVAQIRWIEPLVQLLRVYFAHLSVQGTFAEDSARVEKVADFRHAQTDILVTTTILERGITVPRTDVFVLDADSALFDEAALVQMAGRAGRSVNDPYGKVYYAAYNRSKAQKSAVHHISNMNALAKSKGYLHANAEVE